MPLPFILSGAAIAAASYGAKKGYDGYQDKSKADEIVQTSKKHYEQNKKIFDSVNERTNIQLENLGALQLKIGQDFAEFRKIAEELLKKINQSGDKDLKVSIPAYKLEKIESMAMSATTYIANLAKAGVVGGAAAYAVYGGVMALAAASTGTPIAALSGVAASNATLAAIGGGSLATGGLGIAGGTAVLGGVVVAPILAVAGWAYASHAAEALVDAEKMRQEANDAVVKMELAGKYLSNLGDYAAKVHAETARIYQFFGSYFQDLKAMDAFIRNGGDVDQVEEAVIRIISNGYAVAAILTDLIMTPLFKPKMHLNNPPVIKADGTIEVESVAVDKDGNVEIEKDSHGMQVINAEAIDHALEQTQEQAKGLG